MPNDTPKATSTKALLSTIRVMVAAVAPSAIRIPISFVRRATVYDMSP